MAGEQKRHALKPSRGKQNLFASLGDVFLSQYGELVAAVRFLSVLPAPGETQLFEKGEAAPRLVVGAAYFPLVGLLLACLLWSLVLLLAPLVPQLALAALLVVALVMLTGGLHLDGLMDSCDGLFGGSTRERRLEIMRDSRVGSFGVLGGVCILLLKFALLASVSGHALPLALLVALPSARWAMVLALRVFPSARPTGLGAAFHRATTTKAVILAGIISLAIVLVAGQSIGLLVWGTVTMTALVLGLWITRSIGGLTGDSYGAIAEVVEVVALLVVVMVRA
ncbi:MAG TPA: adenosylcobinamide-GDP ribazoletransferase [Ktedonobacteraceae bacterium]